MKKTSNEPRIALELYFAVMLARHFFNRTEQNRKSILLDLYKVHHLRNHKYIIYKQTHGEAQIIAKYELESHTDINIEDEDLQLH